MIGRGSLSRQECRDVGVADGAECGGADHVGARRDLRGQEAARHLAGVAGLHGLAASAIVAIVCGMTHGRMRRCDDVILMRTHARDGRERHNERENEQGEGAKQPHGVSLEQDDFGGNGASTSRLVTITGPLPV